MKIKLEKNLGNIYVDIDDVDKYNDVKSGILPQHVAIIMDGNGRWAKQKGFNRIEGHREGSKRAREMIRMCREMGIRYLTLYTFSTENWNRPKGEISFLFGMLKRLLEAEIEEIDKNGGRVNFLGTLDGVPTPIRNAAIWAMEKTASNKELTVNLAFNYGGRDEIVRAVKKIASMVKYDGMSIDDIDEKMLADNLDTKGMPDPDLIIRTSGEFRLSNFLCWQSAYSEFYFSDSAVYWPDFTVNRFIDAIYNYKNRKRRFGGLDDES